MAQEATQDVTEQDSAAQQEAASSQEGTGKTFDENYVKGLRAEAAKHRKDAADAKKRAEALEGEKLTETERLQKEADEGRKLAEGATGKLRNANLRDALSEAGYNGTRAKAVAKLLTGVEYDDDDEPTNLTARLKAAAKEYGDIAAPSGGDGGGGFDGGVRGSGGKPMTMNDRIRRAAGRST